MGLENVDLYGRPYLGDRGVRSRAEAAMVDARLFWPPPGSAQLGSRATFAGNAVSVARLGWMLDYSMGELHVGYTAGFTVAKWFKVGRENKLLILAVVVGGAVPGAGFVNLSLIDPVYNLPDSR